VKEMPTAGIVVVVAVVAVAAVTAIVKSRKKHG